jgi:hypothetical protein
MSSAAEPSAATCASSETSASEAAAPAPAPAPEPQAAPAAPAAAAPPSAGSRLRKLLSHSNVSPITQELAGLVADFIDGEWLPEGAPDRAVLLGRRMLAYETQNSMEREASARSGARIAELEAQLQSLLADPSSQSRLMQELSEARASAAALLQQASGDSFQALWEAHAGSLAEENAALKAKLAKSEAELAELKDVLAEAKKSVGSRARQDGALSMFGPEAPESSSMRSRKREEEA